MRIIRISTSDSALLEKFLSSAGKSLETFRYFASRNVEVLDHHKLTILVLDNHEHPIAYGHLDEEKQTIWLGNCVAEKYQGKGIGTLIMRYLINFARDQQIKSIRLSVDNQNIAAIKLYEKFGFSISEKKETLSFYDWELKCNPEILVSSLAFAGKNAEEMIEVCTQENFNLEFSSGLPYREDMEDVFLNCTPLKFAHNYFPAPKVPFVLNLASDHEAIRRRSIEHCVNGIILSYKVGARFFSAHAGFCIDPSPEELGNPLSRKKIKNRSEHWENFISSLKEIFIQTHWTNTCFLIENNVLAKMNLYEDGTNPLFCCDPDEINRLIREMNEPRLGILLDTGHLKVSANTLGFHLKNAVKEIEKNLIGIHHSDNNGEFDTNEQIDENYWFLPFMKNFGHLTHVIEVKKINKKQIRDSIRLLKANVV